MLFLFIKIKSQLNSLAQRPTPKALFVIRSVRFKLSAFTLIELLMVIFLMGFLVSSAYPFLRALRVYQQRIAQQSAYTFFDSQLRTLLEQLVVESSIIDIKNDIIFFANDINLSYKKNSLYLNEKPVLASPFILFESTEENLLCVKVYYEKQPINKKKQRFYELFIRL